MGEERFLEDLFAAGSSLSCAREEDTVELGRRLGERLSGTSAILLLEGEMGAGKTVLVGGIAAGLGLSPEQVQSPTFTLINEYADEAGERRLVHCDLYRLEPEEIESTGLFDLFESSECPVVVEWADRLPWRPTGTVTLRLSRPKGLSRPTGGEHRRVVERLERETGKHE